MLSATWPRVETPTVRRGCSASIRDHFTTTRFQRPGFPLAEQMYRSPFLSTIRSPFQCVPDFGCPEYFVGCRLTAAVPPWKTPPRPEPLDPLIPVPPPLLPTTPLPLPLWPKTPLPFPSCLPFC